MASIDERIVSIAFENAKFEAGVAQTIATLAKLNEALAKAGSVTGFANIEAEANKVTLAGPTSAIDRLKAKLHFPGARPAFENLENESHRVSFSGVTSAIDKVAAKLHFPGARKAFEDLNAADDKVQFGDAIGAIGQVESRFSAMQVAAVAAFGTIVSKATMLGAEMAKGFSFDPIFQGFEEYGLKLNSIQTLMAATGEGIKPVSASLQELNEYSDKTIYSFKDMIENIPKFANAGVKLEPAVKAIQGVAQVAAVSGASTQEAARSMYNFAQAVGSGTLRMQDWRSIEIANMGTVEFKQQLIDTAVEMGTLKKATDGTITSLKGNEVNVKTFNKTLEDQWATAEVLTKTLGKYTDETTELGKKAFASATDIKTLTQLLGIFKESIGSGWAQSFELIFGNLEQAKKLWGGVNDVIGGFIQRNADARNEVLKGWQDMGGRAKLIDALGEAFRTLFGLLGVVRNAFRDIFPRQTAESLTELTNKFAEFISNLHPSLQTLGLLQRSFRGLFAVLHIGWQIVKQVGSVLFDLLGVAGGGAGGFLEITAALGDFLVAVDTAITKGGALKGIFESLGAVLAIPLEIIKALASALMDLFTGGDSKGADELGDSFSSLNEKMKPLRRTLAVLMEAWEWFVGILGQAREAIEPGVTKALEFLGGLGQLVAKEFNSINWENALLALQTGLIGGILLKLKQLFSGGLNIDFGNVLGNLSSALEVLSGHLTAIQRNIQANTLLQIAIAIGLLAAGVLVLSKIPSDKLSTAMTAISIGLAQLIGAMVLLGKAMGSGGGFAAFAKMPFISASMIMLAGAVVVLAVAMRLMSGMEWEELAKGLVGVGGALAAVGASTTLLQGPKIVSAALALIPLAIGLNILAVAVRLFASMSWEELARGLAGAGVAVAGIAMGLSLMPLTLPAIGAGLVLVAFAMTMLAGAVGAFGRMDLKEMVQGLLGVATAITAIGYSVALIPPTVLAQAAGLVVLAVALNGIAAAVAIFGNMDISTLVKGIASIGVVLLVLADGLYLMAGTLPGSAALLAAAAAFAILGPAIGFMGSLKWGTILKGLATMALTLTVLAVAGTLAAAPLTALGIALAALGAGMLVISAALSLFVYSLSLLGEKGPKHIAAMVAAFGAFLLVLPKLIIDFIKGLVVIVAEIAKLAPLIVESLIKIATSLLDAIIELTPKIAEAIGALVLMIVTVLAENAPQIIAAGFLLLLNLLSGIADNMPKVMEQAVNVVLAFLKGLADNAPRLVAGGLEALTNFILGLDSGLPGIVGHIARMVTTFLNQVTKNLPRIVQSGANLITTFLNQLAKAVPRFVAAATNVIIAFLDGIQKAIPRLVQKGLDVARAFLNGLADGLAGLADIGFKAMIRFLRGLEKAIRENQDDLRAAGKGVADAILDAIVDTIRDGGRIIKDAIVGVMKGAVDGAKDFLGIKSPSKVFMTIGQQTIEGFLVGVDKSQGDVTQTMRSTARNVVQSATQAMSDVPNLLDGMLDLDPTITPVLDLSAVEQEARKLGDITTTTPIVAQVSSDTASAIALEKDATDKAIAETAAVPSISLEQNNYSPEALSEVEIYRQTKNQLAQVKSMVGAP